jgi:RNA polymerase sigma factor (sigma-70 family)
MEQEFKALVASNHLLIYKVCRMYCATEADIQDLYQDIMIQLWKAFPSFKGESKISTWIYRIAINTSITQFRKIKRRPMHENISDLMTETISNPESRQEDVDELNKAIALLADIEKAVILLYLDEYSYKEIAEIIGTTESNIGFKINKIKNKLKETLKQ